MTTLDQLKVWMEVPYENEHIEFKEAKEQYDQDKLIKYCVALANEGGGKLILGVTNRRPRNVVGTNAFQNPKKIEVTLYDTLKIHIESEELIHPDGRVVIFHIPSRPVGTALNYQGSYYMRVGDELVAMTWDKIKQIVAEDTSAFLSQIAMTDLDAENVVSLLDTQSYFDFLKLPYPSTREAVLDKFISEKLINRINQRYEITNLGAILFAKQLQSFEKLSNKAPRVVVYDGTDKLNTKLDKTGAKGYAVGFDGLLEFINSQVPANEVIGRAIRENVRMFPEIAIRELVANALIHQDFNETGMSVMIEIYKDRIEISNPGKPFISPERFIDEYKSRNEKLANLMRRMGICEEKGSGVDKVINSSEVFQLPPPDFRVSEKRTIAIVFAHQDFEKMNNSDRIRACYQHCCLRYVMNERMTNQSLRERFKLPEKKAETVSRIIRDALGANKIKLADEKATSMRYRSYLPYWA